MTGRPDSSAEPGFERDARPLFREKDRTSMLRAFDLWSYDDVRAHQDAILGQLAPGREHRRFSHATWPLTGHLPGRNPGCPGCPGSRECGTTSPVS